MRREYDTSAISLVQEAIEENGKGHQLDLKKEDKWGEMMGADAAAPDFVATALFLNRNKSAALGY